MNRLATLACLLVSVLLVACEQQPAEKPLQYSSAPVENQSQIYRLVPHPLYNPQKLSETFQPLVDYLNRQVPAANIQLETSRDYQAFEKKFRAREAEFLMPNPWQTLEANRVGYHVISMWGDAEDFKGIFIVRKDSGIKVPADLKGKVVSYPSPTALAAAIMPQYFLHKSGININKDIQNNYVGSQESSIMNVYLGQSVAGATWPPPWRLFQKDHPAEAAQLKVIWETPSLLNNSVMVRDDVPEAIRQGVRQALLDLPKTPEGRRILAGMETARFHAADDASYNVVREYIKRFEKEVRTVERK
ncbi:MAG: phosphate/phosphite/phosphonate ABC transporter substrate-binding protein [Gallionellaceae bacterium]|nr:phosphate/phosphite/phosphonate ABC transporter substrate-binding protein [Gallionellaceae bacterium]